MLYKLGYGLIIVFEWFSRIFIFKDINYILSCKIPGDMRSTPYTVNGKQEEYSAKRTSKIKYLSERTHQLIARLSQRLDLGLGFNLYNPKYRY